MKKIVIANDHAAVDMKFKIKDYIESLGYEVINVGTDDVVSCDYPDKAYMLSDPVISTIGDDILIEYKVGGE